MYRNLVYNIVELIEIGGKTRKRETPRGRHVFRDETDYTRK